MKLIISLWRVIFLLPLLAFGIVMGFFPHKVIEFRARLQQNMFRALNMSKEDVDRSIYSKIFGQSYSERLEDQSEKPERYKFLAIWYRIIGFFVLFVFLIMLFVIIAVSLDM